MSKKRFDPSNVDPGAHLPVIAAIVWDPAEYPPPMRQIWEDSKLLQQHTTQDFPQIYAGSVREECDACGVGIALGPRQQEAGSRWIEQRVDFEMYCLICAARRVHASQQARTAIVSLDNPEFDHDN